MSTVTQVKNRLTRWLGITAGLVVLSLIVSVPIAFASPPDAGQGGKSGLLVKNYWGQTLILNVADTEYDIPANGQMFIALPPGDYTFSANIPDNDASARTGEIVINAGQTLDMAYTAGQPFFAVESASATTTQTQATPTTQAKPSPSQPSTTTTTQPNKTGVLVKNYWGEPLVFTINDNEYQVPADSQLFIALTPGDYTYSSNVPSDDRSDRTGELVISSGKTVEITSYLNSPLFP